MIGVKESVNVLSESVCFGYRFRRYSLSTHFQAASSNEPAFEFTKTCRFTGLCIEALDLRFHIFVG